MGEVVAIRSRKKLGGVSLRHVNSVVFERALGGRALTPSNASLFSLLLDKGDAEYIERYLTRARDALHGRLPGNDYWLRSVESVLSGVVRILVHARDELSEPIILRDLPAVFAFDRVVALANRCDVPIQLRRPLLGYLHSMPGYIEGSMQEAMRHHRSIAIEWVTTIRALKAAGGNARGA